MSKRLSLVASASAIGALLVAGAIEGCSSSESACGSGGGCTGAGASSATGLGVSVGTGAGGDDMRPTTCDPGPGSLAAGDGCGIFVSASRGDDGNDGANRSTPVQTLHRALALATALSKPIYACAEAFNEEVIQIQQKLVFHGGLDCGHGWVYAGEDAPTTFTASTAGVAITITAAPGTELRDLTIQAAAAALPGRSSIAMIVAGGDVTLTRTTLFASAGAPGRDAPQPHAMMTPAVANGGAGDAGCGGATSANGGVAGANTCSGVDASGGVGGIGSDTAGGDGADGSPPPMPPDSSGAHGSGDTGTGCTKGTAGADGAPGDAGRERPASARCCASGYVGVDGGTGLGPGTVGHGGGGGGGARACTSDGSVGPAGGGGGAGGCPGRPSIGGEAGGSSIGLLLVNASATLTHAKIMTGGAGAGGVGGPGQPGSHGGAAGHAGGTGACDGGRGGIGGRGGSGGGGHGGHSVAVALAGSAAPDLGTTKITLGKFAPGGASGDADPSRKGDDGLKCRSLDFGDPSSCVP